ncbi:hypothetical protein GCM10019059_08360 [Camelimonas fluminis]|uniref:histidine kinase n=1 Tax=Camelimonas fluminis TaxID=1576911 RepID=A0ABV7UEP9_9HYPH|nr:sensor histidine kinase [Camelimonas fluminis]GHE51418.1 hypothetical protein GCM10019059_08360 [Camelimonas fluminis]
MPGETAAAGNPMLAMRRQWRRVLSLTALALGLLALLLLLVAGVARHGQTASPADNGFSLAGRVGVLVDPQGRLTLAQAIASPERFTPASGASVNLGYTRKTAWLRIVMAAPAGESGVREALLSLAPNFVDEIDVYVAQNRPGLTAADFVHYAMGDHRPLPADAVSGLENVVPVSLAPGHETLALVRIASGHSALSITASLYPPAHHTRRVTSGALLSGFWFGGMAVLAAIQVVFFLFDRKPFYILLAFSTCAAMMVYMGNLGVSRLWLFPHGGRGNDWFTGGSVWLGLFASGVAGASILELPRRHPVINRIFQGLACTGLVGVGFALADVHPEFAGPGYLVITTLSTLGMVMGIVGIDRNASGTRLRAAAYTILWCGLIITMVQRTGMLSLPNWVAHAYAVSCLVHTLLLTGSLAVRLRAAEALNKSMREQALQAAQAAERRAARLVETRTAELAEAKRVAEDALQAELDSQERQVRFMEVISHQYRTPLAVIRSNVDSIGLSLPPEDAANRGRLDRVRRGIVRLVETLEVNVARSRLHGAAFAPQMHAHPLADVVATAAARAGDMLSGRISLETTPAARRATIRADAEMLELALINLLENAVKYSVANGAPPVALACDATGADAVITVRDQGVGIPAGEIDAVTARAVRGSNAINTEGSGLGLSLVSRIVAAHGGKLHIDSIAGAGTTVTITLPLASQTDAAADPARAAITAS